jgi:hypothetical protein
MCPEGPGSNRFYPLSIIPDWPLFAYLFPAAQDRSYAEFRDSPE